MKPSRIHFISSLLFLFVFTTMFAAFAIADAPSRCAGCKTEHFLIQHLKNPFNVSSGLSLQPGSSGNKMAIMLLAEGKIDFAYTCKNHTKLAKKFKIGADKTANWVSVPIAKDPILVVANSSLGISDLSSEQLKSIFIGEISNWSEVGGNDQPVTVAYLDKTVESGVVTVFKETATGKKQDLHPMAKRLKSPDQLGHFTKATEGAITFMALNSYRREFGTVLSINGVSPEKQAILEGNYPLSVTYHIVYDTVHGATAMEFLNFLGSDNGQSLIDEIMIAIPVKPIVVP